MTRTKKGELTNQYLYDAWLPAQVITNSGKEYKNLNVKYDVWNNLVEIKVSDECLQTIHGVKTLILSVDETHKLLFENGFPKTNGYDKNTLYQVLTSGTVKLLKKSNKNLLITKDYSSAIENKKLQDGQEYFIYKNDQIVQLNRNKKSLIKAFPDKQDQILAYVNYNKINLHRDSELEKVFSYYNSLDQ